MYKRATDEYEVSASRSVMQGHSHSGTECHPLERRPAEALAEIFTAFADGTRVRIISALVSGEVCVGELAAALGMSVSAVSHQLRLLRSLHVVTSRRSGRHIYYTLADEHIARMYQYALEHSLEGKKRDLETLGNKKGDSGGR